MQYDPDTPHGEPIPPLYVLWDWKQNVAMGQTEYQQKAGPVQDILDHNDGRAYPFWLRQVRQWRQWNEGHLDKIQPDPPRQHEAPNCLFKLNPNPTPGLQDSPINIVCAPHGRNQRLTNDPRRDAAFRLIPDFQCDLPLHRFPFGGGLPTLEMAHLALTFISGLRLLRILRPGYLLRKEYIPQYCFGRHESARAILWGRQFCQALRGPRAGLPAPPILGTSPK